MPILTGTYTILDGVPAKGTVEIIPVGEGSKPLRQIIDSDGNVILSGRAKVELDAAGHFSIDLPATDDPTLNPTGFGYTVAARLHHTHLPAVSFSLPAATPTVDIADVTTVDPSTFTPGVTYVTPAELDAAVAGVVVGTSGLEAEIATKADADEISAALALKANASSLAAKADASRVTTLEDERTTGRLSESGLSGAFARGGTGAAPESAAPLLAAVPVAASTVVNIAVGYNPATGTYYGTSAANGHYITSTDLVTWTDRTYSPSTYTPNVFGYEFDATNMYAYSTGGKVWRAALDVFNAWTEISVPTRGPLTGGRPGSLCALGSGVLIYGNYTSGAGDGAHIWRSIDSGSTWTEVLSIPTGKHIHAIRRSPNTGWLWASIGDAGFTGTGLWKSDDAGVTWVQMSSNDYGIDMVFAAADDRHDDRIILEGDGLNRPLLMGFDEHADVGSKTYPLVWFTGAPADALSTRGTTRGIGKTPAGDVVFFTTTESGAVGSKSGIYIAQAPDFTRAVLLKDTTGAESVAYMTTYATAALVHNYRTQFATPTFGSF